jgi:beta-glucosidase
MADIDQADPSPMEGAGEVTPIDTKHAAIHVQPVSSTPTLTPATTPDADDHEAMAGKKIFGKERADDKARELAAKLTLEEQVSYQKLLLVGAYMSTWTAIVL